MSELALSLESLRAGANSEEPATRVEDEPILTGRAKFTADVGPANCLHAAFVRSPFARARLRTVDIEAALRAPGVRLVLTAESVESCPWLSVNQIFPNMRQIERSLLASGNVDAVGEAVALVVADTEFGARDAAERIEIEYDPGPAMPDADTARNGRPIVEGWPDNVVFEHRWTNGDCDSVFAAAKQRVAMQLDLPRISAVALETRGAVAEWDPSARQLTAWLPTQTPHRARAELARMLGLTHEKVRVINPYVGGAFGAKASLYPEDVVVALAAIKLGRGVRWIPSRNEDFVATSHGRGAQLQADAAIDATGRFLALRANLIFPLGFWSPYSGAVPAWNAGRILPGPYGIDAVDVRVTGVLTNATPIGILRGAGRPEAVLVMERLIDEAARVLHLDPADIRRKNLIRADRFPYATPTGEIIDSGDFEQLLERTLQVSGYRSARAERPRPGTLRGTGICLYTEPCGRGWESARVSREPSGRILVACGTSAQGQGHRTTFAQIAAESLQIPIADIDVIEGDSAATPEGVGALASRSVAIGGSAVRAAAELLRDRLRSATRAEGLRIEASVVYRAPAEAWASGCCVAAVEVDPETGDLKVLKLSCVDDCGIVISPALFTSQLIGGLAQGIGHALRERILYDEHGQLLTGSLMDYALPRADEMPLFDTHSMHTETKSNLLGAKGIGEAGCIAAPAAILNAAHDALRACGAVALRLPLTSESIWRAMHT